MLRLVRQKLRPKRTVWKTLQAVYGLSTTSIHNICAHFGLNQKTRIKHLTKRQIARINYYVSANYLIFDALRYIVTSAYTAIYDSRRRRGLRMRQGLPVNGQRTRSNASTSGKLKMKWLSYKYKQKLRRLKFRKLQRLQQRNLMKKYRSKKR